MTSKTLAWALQTPARWRNVRVATVLGVPLLALATCGITGGPQLETGTGQLPASPVVPELVITAPEVLDGTLTAAQQAASDEVTIAAGQFGQAWATPGADLQPHLTGGWKPGPRRTTPLLRVDVMEVNGTDARAVLTFDSGELQQVRLSRINTTWRVYSAEPAQPGVGDL